MIRTVRSALAGAVLAASVVPPIALSVGVSPASAAVTCAKWAASTGNNWAPGAGSSTAPVKTLDRLASLLAPGETGCIKNGSTLSWQGDGGGNNQISASGSAGLPITIQPEPGGTATILGYTEIKPDAHDIVLKGLRFIDDPAWTNTTAGNLVQINGDRVTISDSEIVGPRNICVGVGAKADASGRPTTDTYNPADTWVFADDIALTRNRIHGCGMSPALAPTESGAHGVYLVAARRANVTDNLIYNNWYRGLQTWPRSSDVLVANNLFDDNATHVNIGSALSNKCPADSTNPCTFRSERITVRNNIMTNRRTTFEPSKNPAAIFGNYPSTTTSTQYGNAADGNCIDTASAPISSGYGIHIGAQDTGSPLYTNRAAGDFRLLAGSPCVGKGPASIQPPQTPASFAVSVPAPATTTPGSTQTYTWTIRNTGGTAGAAYTWLSLNQSIASPGARLVSQTPSQGACSTATTCQLGTIAPGATATVRVTVDILRTTGFSLNMTAATAPDTVDAEAWIAPTVTGSSCTVIGTNSADTLVGATGANDVICGFAGNDTIRPGGGNDVVHGGTGTDTVSYSGQASGVVVNLGQSSAWDNGTGTTIGWDTFTSIESAIGTASADKLLGNAANNTLTGIAGNDELWGYDGNDTLAGGAGADKLYGGNGNDAFDGGTESDLCRQDTGTGTRTACEQA